MGQKHPNSSNSFFRYGLALLANALAFVLTWWAMPVLHQNAFDFYIGAVVITACYVGIGPALLNAALAIPMLDYFFMPPFNSFSVSIPDFVRLAVFGFVALLTSSLSGRLKAAKYSLQKARDELEMRVMQRTEELMRTNTKLENEISHRLTAEKEILQISQREQRRLGEDLHDGLCQTLVGIRYLTQDLQSQAAADGLRWSKEVETINLHLREALTQAELVARGLYPVELEAHGLVAALHEFVDKISVIYNVHCRVWHNDIVMTHDLPIMNHLYRIVQEAVINGIKHGHAKRITIRLKRAPSALKLSITDDGVGFQGSTPRNGMGLKMMTYRARMINATFHVRSRRRGVTRVSCKLSHEKEPHNGNAIEQDAS